MMTFAITNSYVGKNHLLSTEKDIVSLKSIFKASLFTLSNMSKVSLFKSLDTIKNFTHKNHDTALIIFSGHGAYDNKNNLEIFYDNDLKPIYVHEILEFFAAFQKIIVIIDTCQVIESSDKVKIIKLPNKEVFIFCAIPKGQFAFGNKTSGGFFIHEISRVMKITKINTFHKLMLSIIVGFENYITKHDLIPKIYANHLARQNNSRYISQFQSLTDQSDASIQATKLNSNYINNEIVVIDGLIEKFQKELRKCSSKNERCDLRNKLIVLYEYKIKLNYG